METENVIDKAVNQFLDENPDVMNVFIEVFDRANLSNEEVYVFCKTLYKFYKGISVSWIKQIFDSIESNVINADEKAASYEV